MSGSREIPIKQVDTQIVDPFDSSRKMLFDSKFKVPVVIPIEHYEIHEGNNFECHINSANLAVASLNAAFKTLAGNKLIHILLGYSSDDEILFEVVEGPTWLQGSGTALTIFNNNRDSGSNSVAVLENKNQPTFTASNQVIKDVTSISGGTIIKPEYTYNASVGIIASSETRSVAHEWVFKNDTTYVIRMTKTDANCKMSIALHWYEHTDE